MSTTAQDEMADRKRVMVQDASLRKQQEQGSAYIDHYKQEMGGRFSAQGAAYVVGSKADVAGAYSAASAAHQIQLPNEEPLGFSVDEMPNDPVGKQGQDGPADAPSSSFHSPLAVECAGSSLSQGGSAPEVQFPASVSANAGPSRLRRF
jgi:hypothetical protein